MKRLKFLVFIAMTLCLNVTVWAQDNDQNKFSANVDLFSRHVWRGNANGNVPSVQPYMAYRMKSFEVGSWAAYSLDDSYAEFDLYLQYFTENFSLTLFDYYAPKWSPKVEFDYGDLNVNTTHHTFDVVAKYNLQWPVPVQITLASKVWGDDKDAENKNRYSSYYELAVPFAIKSVKGSVCMGGTPYKSSYGSPGITHFTALLSRKCMITQHYGITLHGRGTYNLNKEEAYFLVGITF